MKRDCRTGLLLRVKPKGFTLIELIVTVAIAAVLLGLAVPSMSTFILNSRLTGNANDLVRSYQVARTEAIKQHQIAIVCAATGTSTSSPTCSGGSFSTGWIVFTDVDQSGQYNAGDVLIETHNDLDTKVTVNADSNGFTAFDSSGARAANPIPTTSIVLCDSRGTASISTTNSAAHVIFIDPTGRIRSSQLISDVGGGLPCP